MKNFRFQLKNKNIAAIVACFIFAVSFTACENKGYDFIFTDSISFEQEGITVLRVGETVRLNLNIEPANATKQNLRWASSNEKIATVNERGEVTALATGTVSILVETDKYSGSVKFANCLIAVIDEPQITFTAINNTLTFRAYSRSGQANNTIVIDWGDGSEFEAHFGGRIFEKRYTTDAISRTVRIYGDIDRFDSFLNTITDIDVTGATKLQRLDVRNGALRSLDVSNNAELTELFVPDNFLSSLDVSNNTRLMNLDCSNNELTELNLGSINLGSLFAQGNRLRNLDFSTNLNLSWVNLNNNRIEQLNISENSNLTRLSVQFNHLPDIDVSNNPKLISLLLCHNRLTDVDVSNNPKLTGLSLSSNRLTDVDVSNNTELESLSLFGNQLTGLDVSTNTNLIDVDVRRNQFSANALNEFMNTLHNFTINIPQWPNREKRIRIGLNEGTDESDTNIAKEKGWIVTTGLI
jgi:hypothetical protein